MSLDIGLGVWPFLCAFLQTASFCGSGLTIHPVSSILGDRSENSIVLVCFVTAYKKLGT